MPQGSDQPIPVALLVDEDSNPLEVGCACEVFGARRRADLGRELYDLRVAPGGRATAHDGLFSFADAGDLTELDAAHTVVVPTAPTSSGRTTPTCWPRSAGRSTAAPG